MLDRRRACSGAILRLYGRGSGKENACRKTSLACHDAVGSERSKGREGGGMISLNASALWRTGFFLPAALSVCVCKVSSLHVLVVFLRLRGGGVCYVVHGPLVGVEADFGLMAEEIALRLQ